MLPVGEKDNGDESKVAPVKVKVELLLAERKPPEEAKFPPIVSAWFSKKSVVPALNDTPPAEVVASRSTVPFEMVAAPVMVITLANVMLPEEVLLNVKLRMICEPAGKGNVPKAPVPFITKSHVAPEKVMLLPLGVTDPFKVSDRTSTPLLMIFKLPEVSTRSPGISRIAVPEFPDVVILNVTPLALAISVVTPVEPTGG